MKDEKCEKCGQRSTAVKVVRILDGKTTTLYLCRECAAEATPLQHGFALQEIIDKFLEQILKNQVEQEAEGEAPEGPELRCSSCGTTVDVYRKSFLLGCPQCYSAFGEMLDPQLRKLHGSARHVGRVPERQPRPGGPEDAPLAKLKQELVRAVSREDFETAAQLRDRIFRLLQGGSNHVYPEMPKM